MSPIGNGTSELKPNCDMVINIHGNLSASIVKFSYEN